MPFIGFIGNKGSFTISFERHFVRRVFHNERRDAIDCFSTGQYSQKSILRKNINTFTILMFFKNDSCLDNFVLLVSRF